MWLFCLKHSFLRLGSYDPQITPAPSAGATGHRMAASSTGMTGADFRRMKDERTYKIIRAAMVLESADFTD